MKEQLVDLHIHSHYSRATSRHMNITDLYRWGKIKGIHIMGTGDFTHPAWFEELQACLEPAEDGFFELKKDLAAEADRTVPASCRNSRIRFVLSVEISTIYSKKGSVRKLHNLVVMPSFAAASAFNAALQRIGNLRADGRPILGLDSKELFRIALEACADTLFIPAHIWTPWFGLFGSKSGFDSIVDAFEELAPQIKVVETGLSSDPYMNWRISQLDGVTLLSHSDAHSPEKLGREANVVKDVHDYASLRDILVSGDERFIGTVEFFPQEGKYHYDGHRACGVRLAPEETKQLGGICPKCGHPLVVGVEYRVNALADRPVDFRPRTHARVEYIIPLAEMIAEIKHVKSVSAKSVKAEYMALIASLGDEFSVLRTTLPERMREAGFPQMAEAIRRMRAGNVTLEPGYDGVYGTVKVFAASAHVERASGQLAIGV